MSTYGSLEGDLELTELLDLDIESLDGALKRLDLGVGGIHTEVKVDSLDKFWFPVLQISGQDICYISDLFLIIALMNG